MKPYEFFIRFDLQRSGMAFPLENFPYEKTPDASPREIDAYLAACEGWISTAAERLKQTTGAEKS